MLISLKTLKEELSNTQVKKTLKSFFCAKTESSDDINEFIHLKALKMEKERQSATYIDLDENKSKVGDFVINGYFSIAIKVFEFDENISIDEAKEISGKNDKVVPAYLIGQLAISKDIEQHNGSGTSLLKEAISKIKTASEIVGGRIVYVDCKDECIDFYRKNNFKKLSKDKETGYNQMYLVI